MDIKKPCKTLGQDDSKLHRVCKVWKTKQVKKKIGSTSEMAIGQCFEKYCEIINDGGTQLPGVSTWFIEQPWQIKELQDLKLELNEIKSKLNDFNLTEWNRHTSMRNKAGQVQWMLKKRIHPEFLTQAWCKLYENVCSFGLIPEKSLAANNLNTVHLCEAPGAFVTALNHWIKLNAPEIQWSWLATTLNPHYEGNSPSTMIDNDCFIIHSMDNWYFGSDNTGNLMNLKNLFAIAEKAGTKAALVTADGSINCIDSPNEQEQIVSQLHYCEAVAALHLLEKDGSFLLKIFTIFEQQTVCLIYLLSRCFHKIYINKPVTSKEGNSEVYVVCLGFAGPDFVAPYMETLRKNYEKPSEMAMFRKSDIPSSFIQQIYACADFFKAHQCEVILDNIRTFGGETGNAYRDLVELNNIRRAVADRFIKQYRLRPLASEESEVVGRSKLFPDDNTTLTTLRRTVDSYNSRRRSDYLSPKDHFTQIVENLKFIEQPDTEFTFKMKNFSQQLRIVTGKPYTRVKSSKFCSPNVLRIYNSTLDIMDNIGCVEIPSSETVKMFIGEGPPDRTIINFGYTGISDSHKLIIQIFEALSSLEKSQTLTFLGYSLLPQLNVGILYLLAHTFQSVELLSNTNLGCVINLKSFTKIEMIADILREVIYASRNCQSEGGAVLSILPISTLCDSILYLHILKINHWVIRHCVSHMFASITL